MKLIEFFDLKVNPQMAKGKHMFNPLEAGCLKGYIANGGELLPRSQRKANNHILFRFPSSHSCL